MAGIRRTREVEQPHLRPWATVLRAQTTGGTVWFKACGPATAFEVGLYRLIDRVAPEHVLSPIAADLTRAWIVLPDGGLSLGDHLTGAELARAMETAMSSYGHLQRTLAPHVGDLLALGITDMRARERAEDASRKRSRPWAHTLKAAATGRSMSACSA